MATFFISYSRQDAAVANNIRNHISRLDSTHDVFLDVISIKAGANWKSELEKRVFNTDYFILVYSAQSVKSKHVAEELKWIRASELKTGLRKLIVYRLDYAEISADIASYQVLDATDNFAIDFYKLMQGIFADNSFYQVDYDIEVVDEWWYKGKIWIEAPKKFLSKIQMAEYRFDYGWNENQRIKTVPYNLKNCTNKFAVRFETKYHFTIFVMLYLWNTKELPFVRKIHISH